MRRLTRIAGTVMLLAGVAVLAWVLVVWRWQHPFTAAYTHWKQHQLSESYKHRFAEYRPVPAARAATVSVPVARSARRSRRRRVGTGFTLSAVRRSAASRSRGWA